MLALEHIKTDIKAKPKAYKNQPKADPKYDLTCYSVSPHAHI